MESTNHRINEVGREFWSSSGTQAGSPRSGCSLSRSVSRWLLIISKDGASKLSLGNLCECLISLTVMFPDVQMEFSVFQFVPIPSGPVTGHH